MNDFLMLSKNKLIMHLESIFINIKSLNALSDMSERLEQEIREFCKLLILNQTRMFFENFIGNTKFYNYLVDNCGKRFFLRFIVDLQDFQEVLFLIYEEGDIAGRNTQTYCVRVNGYGRCNKIVLKISRNLKLKNENLPQMFKIVYETAYSWFGIKIESFVSQKTVSVANNVYNYMRKVLCNDRLYKMFWLAVVGKGYGFRLVNEEQVRALFKTFSINQDFSYSVNDYVGNLLSTRLPYDELLMKEALDSNEKINGDISGAKYTKEGNIYSKTMYALYNGDAFSIYPIFQGDIGIVALFPVEYKEEIEFHLDYMKNDIVEEIKKEMANIELAYLLFDDDYKEHLNAGIDLSVTSKGVTVMNEMEKLTEVLDIYYKVYCQFKEDFVFDSNKIYSSDELQYRKTLVDNGMLRKIDGGYCIANKGIQFKEDGNISKGNKMIDNSGNNGIIIMGDGKNVGNPKYYSGGSAKDYCEVIESIRNVVNGSENEEYVESLLRLLEKELNNKEPKPNMIKTILTNLASISTISTFVIKLKELIPF